MLEANEIIVTSINPIHTPPGENIFENLTNLECF